MSDRVRVRSFDNATGSVTANVTPDRSHAWRVNASASKPGGSLPGACATRRDRVSTRLEVGTYGELLMLFAMVSMQDR